MDQRPNSLEEMQPLSDGTMPYSPVSPPGPAQEVSGDPLVDAASLPTLFPEYPEQTPQEDVVATVVGRPKKKKKRTWLKILLLVGKFILGLLLCVLILAAGLIAYLTVTEYHPAYAELAQRGAKSNSAKVSDMKLRIVTFNTGYGGLGEDADFFMDGGIGVNPPTQEVVKENMIGIERILADTDADLLLLQEVDTDSGRSFHMNQWLQYEHDLEDYESRHALNYSCDYVPYPLSEPMGEIHSGLATYSRFDISSATRYALPCPFSWPSRVANLKRCFLVTRIPIERMEQELVVVNFHLEAYDDGEGKEAQTRQLMEFLQKEYEKGNYVVAGGDFNQSFPNTVEHYPILEGTTWTPGLLEELPEGWQYAYDASRPTCRLLNEPYQGDAGTQYYVIDGFIVSPNIAVDRVDTLDEDFQYSDHNPVQLDLELLIS